MQLSRGWWVYFEILEGLLCNMHAAEGVWGILSHPISRARLGLDSPSHRTGMHQWPQDPKAMVSIQLWPDSTTPARSRIHGQESIEAKGYVASNLGHTSHVKRRRVRHRHPDHERDGVACLRGGGMAEFRLLHATDPQILIWGVIYVRKDMAKAGGSHLRLCCSVL